MDESLNYSTSAIFSSCVVYSSFQELDSECESRSRGYLETHVVKGQRATGYQGSEGLIPPQCRCSEGRKLCYRKFQ